MLKIYNIIMYCSLQYCECVQTVTCKAIYFQLYAPLVLEEGNLRNTIDPKLQTLISDLEAGLSSAIRKNSTSFQSHGNVENIGGISADMYNSLIIFWVNFLSFNLLVCLFICRCYYYFFLFLHFFSY